MSLLDDPELLRRIDRGGMGRVLERWPEALLDALRIGGRLDVSQQKKDVKAVVWVGIGGSAIGGDLVKGWASDRSPLPIEVCRDYHLPHYAGRRTLTVGVSYSGETPETLNAFKEALGRGGPVIGVSSGGALEKLCAQKRALHAKVPGGLAPRGALPYLMVVPLLALAKLGLVGGVEEEILDAHETLKELRERLRPTVPTPQNEAKRLALGVAGTLPLIYGFREFTPVAYRIKTQINENSKTLSKAEALPELGHNEVEGWVGVPKDLASRLSVIFLRTPTEPQEIGVRIAAVKEIVSKRTKRVFEIRASGRTKLAQILSAIFVGDYLSYYLALLNRVDPTTLTNIPKVKRKVSQRR